MESINDTIFSSNFPNKGMHVLGFGLRELPENFDYILRGKEKEFNIILFTKDKIGVIELDWNNEHPRCIMIDYLWVDNKQRIDGYTKALLDVAEQFATNIGMYQIRIHTATKAQKEYILNRGYAEIDSYEDGDLGVSFTLLEKTLIQHQIMKTKILESI